MSRSHNFNAHHSPIGAFASFTLGYRGARGGFGLEIGKPADQSIYIGLETPEGTGYEALPFFKDAEDESRRYDQTAEAGDKAHIAAISAEKLVRRFNLCTDSWQSGDLTYTIYSQVCPVPDPETAGQEELMRALVPAVLAEITVDNSRSTRPRRGFFGFQGTDPTSKMSLMNDTSQTAQAAQAHIQLTGISRGLTMGIATDDAGVHPAVGFSAEHILGEALPENWTFGLGDYGLLLFDTPAGEVKTYTFALSFFREGRVTTGLHTRYYYTRYFTDLEHVSRFLLADKARYIASCQARDAWLNEQKLTDDQRFMLAYAIRSYYGSTEFLEAGDAQESKPFWIVNEGEYCMMNTFDLTVDHLFYELQMNPWTVRNELDMFVERYSYTDGVRFPGDEKVYPGGISFTHDMGVGNVLSRPGYSSYEKYGLDGCFSHMTHEQLVNWVLCASVYVEHTGDAQWLKRNLQVLEHCLESMLNRDHPDPQQRNGLMGLDSTRTMGGAEITTYDSLDESLGQARNNIYMAGKCWASYLAMEKLFCAQGNMELATIAAEQAGRCANTLVAHLKPEGYIPAIVGEANDSRIIPAIEGLVFPYFTGRRDALAADGPYGHYLAALRTHLTTVLQPDVCLFPDGGWKLSSTSDNSWLSKIYLCQFIARQLLGMDGKSAREQADAAHVNWLLHPEKAYYAWSDQMIAGVAVGSKYYPRGVTAILWLQEGI